MLQNGSRGSIVRVTRPTIGKIFLIVGRPFGALMVIFAASRRRGGIPTSRECICADDPEQCAFLQTYTLGEISTQNQDGPWNATGCASFVSVARVGRKTRTALPIVRERERERERKRERDE